MNDLQTMLTQLRDLRREHCPSQGPYFGAEDFVLRHGRRFAGRPRPAQWTRQEPKQCFYNSQLEVLSTASGLIYVEGYVFVHIPILHAWCIDETGEVVDLTLQNPTDETMYWGCEFKPDYVHGHWLRTGEASSLLDNWTEGWPLLTGAHPVEEALVTGVRRDDVIGERDLA